MNAIEWMQSKSTVETLEDGTVTYTFSGVIPAKMKREVVSLATTERFTNRQSVYSHNSKTFGWSAVFGASKSNSSSVHFTFNDYTVPMGL